MATQYNTLVRWYPVHHTHKQYLAIYNYGEKLLCTLKWLNGVAGLQQKSPRDLRSQIGQMRQTPLSYSKLKER